MVVLAGCDLFTTRDAEEPESTSDLCGPATSSDYVTSVIECALQFHLPEEYLAVFDAEGYQYTPDGAALGNYSDLLPWEFNQEANHIRRLFSEQVVPLDSVVWVEFESEESVELGDSARYLEAYTLYIGHVLEGVPRQVSGRMELTVVRTIDGTWIVRRWRDEAVGNEATWSDIRALIR
jgi:hypothetical protein